MITERGMRRKLEAADRAYYDYDDPIMSDEEYDILRREYEEQYGSLDYVPGKIKEGFETFQHPIPLLSLNKLYDDDPDIQNKVNAVLTKFGGTVILQPKVDGLTVAAYKNDNECIFVTRGRKGVEGEILPAFIPSLSSPAVITDPNLAVRGEVYLTKTNFEEIQKIQEKQGEDLFANPRNAAAGILRNKDISPYLSYLSYVVYEIPGSDLSTKEQLEILRERTSFTVIESMICSSNLLQSVRTMYDNLKEKDIPVDGIVIKPYTMENSYSTLGQTMHHPNNAIAWKRAADIYQTTVTNVVWQTGRERITPVAILKPVEIDGTTITRATLHNYGFLKKLQLRKGDVVNICKSGEVIPKITSVYQSNAGLLFSKPAFCPSCEYPTEVYTHDDITDVCCVNPYCQERIVQNMDFLASKEVLNVKGFSKDTARKIVKMYGTQEKELILFSMTVNKILRLSGFAKKSAENLYRSLLDALTEPVTIPVFIKACCVSGIGSSVGNILEKEFGTLANIREALNSRKRLENIQGIGNKTAVILTSDEFIEKFEALEELLTVKESEVKQGALSGTVWVITGKLPISRVQAENLIQSYGGTVTNSISKKTDYLLTTDIVSSSRKMQKAKELGIKIVSYSYLLSLISKEEGEKEDA